MTADDDELLARAMRGDERAFDALLAPHRRRVAAHCYRMLGSVADADDAVQETWLRAWKALPGFERRAAVSTWLYRVATRVCLDALEKRQARMLPHERGAPSSFGGAADLGALLAAPPDDEVAWLEPAPAEWGADAQTPERALEQKESVRLAFVAALQHLPASQRAVLLLRDVLGWSADDTARLLEMSVAAANSALQRARESTASRPLLAKPRPPEPSMRALLERYIAAWESGVPEVFADVLRQDVRLTMPPLPLWLEGRGGVIELALALRAALGELRFALVDAAGGLAVLAERRGPDGAWRPSALHVCEAVDDRIVEIHAFVDERLLERVVPPARRSARIDGAEH